MARQDHVQRLGTVAVLAVVGSALPTAMRTFLLTLAVVDDPIALIIIAFVYTDSVRVLFLGGAAVLLGIFWVLTHKYANWFIAKRWAAWVILLPFGVATWWFVYEAGVHATIAGVLLGFMVPVMKNTPRVIRHEDPEMGLAPALEHRFRPLSNGLVIPIFAFLSAGVAVGGIEGINSAATDPVALGIVAGLLIGKPVGIFGASWLMDRFSPAVKDNDYTWTDMFGMSFVAGIGFTVSLLVTELSFGTGSPHNDHARAGILFGSMLAAVIGGIMLLTRNATYKKIRAHGVDPDVYDNRHVGEFCREGRVRCRPEAIRAAPLVGPAGAGRKACQVATRGQTDMRGLGTAGRCSARTDRVSTIQRGTATGTSCCCS
ncbi:Na+/H+ antiporter NhaA [Kocuria marina]|uniref:Na+/H+ antiporter NhaA n=1 Tax=Kocuria marina TaxID=223184 RepID=UPI0021B5ADF2|nr:Na+/H+ antiporter NhaA [Kocuria indica]